MNFGKKVILSLKSNKTGIGLIILAAIFTSIGQLFWKLAEGDKLLFLFAGFLLYFLGLITMLFAFRFGKLSVLHPLLSTGYFFSLLLGFYVLGEIITFKEIIAVIFILLGAALIGGGDS